MKVTSCILVTKPTISICDRYEPQGNARARSGEEESPPFPFPPLPLESPFAYWSRVTLSISPKWRALILAGYHFHHFERWLHRHNSVQEVHVRDCIKLCFFYKSSKLIKSLLKEAMTLSVFQLFGTSMMMVFLANNTFCKNFGTNRTVLKAETLRRGQCCLFGKDSR